MTIARLPSSQHQARAVRPLSNKTCLPKVHRGDRGEHHPPAHAPIASPLTRLHDYPHVPRDLAVTRLVLPRSSRQPPRKAAGSKFCSDSFGMADCSSSLQKEDAFRIQRPWGQAGCGQGGSGAPRQSSAAPSRPRGASPQQAALFPGTPAAEAGTLGSHMKDEQGLRVHPTRLSGFCAKEPADGISIPSSPHIKEVTFPLPLKPKAWKGPQGPRVHPAQTQHALLPNHPRQMPTGPLQTAREVKDVPQLAWAACPTVLLFTDKEAFAEIYLNLICCSLNTLFHVLPSVAKEDSCSS